MRKVDKIDITVIEPDVMNKRMAKFNDREVNLKTQWKLMKLPHWLDLRLQSNSQIFPILRRIYNDIDFYMEKEINSYLVCAKGCAHCCKVPVEVSFLEAIYIERSSKHKINFNRHNNNKLTERVDSYCPFLDQEKAICTIYKYRPLACRLFGTFDSWEKCEDSFSSHYIHCFKSQEFFINIHHWLIERSQKIGEKNNHSYIADIREWFNTK